MNQPPLTSSKAHLRLRIACLCVIGAALFGVGQHYFFKQYPDRGAQLHFSTKFRDASWKFGQGFDYLRSRLLEDNRLISRADVYGYIHSGPARNDGTPHPWPLIGVVGSEFQGLMVVPEETSRGAGIRFNFRSKDMYSNKVRDLRILISSAIGSQKMTELDIWIDEEGILPRLGDGA
jgi:hypothetical protein